MKIQTNKKRSTLWISGTATIAALALTSLSFAGPSFDQYDTNYDGSITMTEYSKKHYEARSKGQACSSTNHLCDKGFGTHLWNQFTAMDSNKNGSVTRSEFNGTSSAPAGSAPKTVTPSSSAPKTVTPSSSAPKTVQPKGSAPAPAPQGSAPKGSSPK